MSKFLNMEQKLVQKQAQKLLFTPKMQESMQILQMPLIELKAVLESEMENNPLLEEAVQEIEQPPYMRPNTEDEDRRKDLYLTKPLTLQENLRRQLGVAVDSQEDIKIGEEIIGNIDDDGYLKISSEEIAQLLNKDVQKIESVIAMAQGLEPIGVCARDLKECLLIQLKAKGKKDTPTWKIVENHLEECGKKQYLKIAKAMGISIALVKECVQEISRLEPKPGRQYSSQTEAQYIIPDIFIKKIDNEYQLSTNKFDIPALKINSNYNSLLNDKNSDKETKDYIKEKMRAANFLIKCIHERQKTMQRIVGYLVNEQGEFIEKGRSFLRPLTFKTVAQAIGRHESTISRAIENKYVETPCGIYKLREFFSGEIKNGNGNLHENGNTSHSATSVKAELKDTIDKEDRVKPLSDQKLQKILEDKDIKISRRAIAKYREELKILPSHLRKS